MPLSRAALCLAAFLLCTLTAVRSEAADPGALVDVSMDSRVGVLLDEVPAKMRDRVAAAMRAQPASF